MPHLTEPVAPDGYHDQAEPALPPCQSDPISPRYDLEESVRKVMRMEMQVQLSDLGQRIESTLRRELRNAQFRTADSSTHFSQFRTAESSAHVSDLALRPSSPQPQLSRADSAIERESCFDRPNGRASMMLGSQRARNGSTAGEWLRGNSKLWSPPIESNWENEEPACEPDRFSKQGPYKEFLYSQPRQSEDPRDLPWNSRPTIREHVDRPVYNFVENPAFDKLCGVLVFLYAVELGIQTDYMARHWMESTPMIFRVFDVVFLFWFCVEVSLRIYVHCVDGRAGTPGFWFNCFVVFLQVVDEVLRLTPIPRNNEYRQGFALLRSLRTIRLFRLMSKAQIAEEMHLLVTSIMGSLRSLFCSIFVIVFFTYLFGVPLTQLVTDYKHAQGILTEEAEREVLGPLEEFYGSLTKTMLALFQSVSEGVHWRELMLPISTNFSPLWKLVFVVYIAFSVLAMMNILTGIFVESAMRTAEAEKKYEITEAMQRLFDEADEDGSGSVSCEEFLHIVGHNAKMQEYLKLLNIHDQQAADLFDLVDLDGSGFIDSREFTYGCLRLQGAVQAIDFASFTREWRQMKTTVEKISRRLGG